MRRSRLSFIAANAIVSTVALALGCGPGPDSGPPRSTDTKTTALDDPDDILEPTFYGDALLTPGFMSEPVIPPWLLSTAGYINTAYGFIKTMISLVDPSPDLAALILQAERDILNEIRRDRAQDLDAAYGAAYDLYRELIQNWSMLSSPDSTIRQVWSDNLANFMTYSDTAFQNFRQIVNGDHAPPDGLTAYDMIIHLNLIATMRATIMASPIDGLPVYSAASINDLLLQMKQANYDYIGANLTYLASQMEAPISTVHRSKLWKTSKFAAATNVGYCFFPSSPDVVGEPDPDNALYVGDTVICDLTKQTCTYWGCGPSRCSSRFPMQQDRMFAACLKLRNQQVDDKFNQDDVVNGVRYAQQKIVAVLDAAVTDSSGANGPESAYIASMAPFFVDVPIAAVARAPGKLDVVYRSADDAIWHIAWNGSTPAAPVNLQPAIVGIPSLVNVGPNRLELFGRGTDSTVYRQVWTAPSPPPNALLTGSSGFGTSSPTIGTLWSGWSGWQGLGGVIVDSPRAAATGAARVDLMANGTNRVTFDNTELIPLGFQGWAPASGSTRVFQSAPIPVSWGPNRYDVFGMGLAGDLQHIWNDGGAGGSESLGGELGSLAAVSWGLGRLDIIGIDENVQPWHKVFDGTWRDVNPGPGGWLSSRPSVVSMQPGRLDLFGRGTDGRLWHNWFQNETWMGWESLGGAIVGNPIATSWGSGRLDVFVVRRDGVIARKFFDGQWHPLEGYEPFGGAVDLQALEGERLAPAGDLNVVVESATYGGNCGAPAGNDTANLQSACQGKQSCSYQVAYWLIGDPVPDCAKNYVATYYCPWISEQRTAVVAPEAGYGSIVSLSCQ